jgi:hypothetical protein
MSKCVTCGEREAMSAYCARGACELCWHKDTLVELYAKLFEVGAYGSWVDRKRVALAEIARLKAAECIPGLGLCAECKSLKILSHMSTSRPCPPNVSIKTPTITVSGPCLIEVR